MLSVFYVLDNESEWESDREETKIGEQFCYVKYIDNDDCSNFGYICFQKNCSGLMRIAMIGSWSDGLSSSDFYYCTEDIYQKKNNEFFLHGSGGAMSIYGKSYGGGMC